MEIKSTEVVQTASVTKLVPDKRFVGTFKSGDTTPSVNAIECWKANGTAMTNFDDGVDGQTILVLGDGIASVVHGSKIKALGAATHTLNASTIYKFVRFDSVWYEH